MPIDIACSSCGREPSHPQVRYRFIYAAYCRPDRLDLRGPRTYVAALCLPCYDADRQAKTSTARNRFFRHVSRWSGLASNRERIVRLLEHPEGVTGTEWEADNCFLAGVAAACQSLVPVEGAPEAIPDTAPRS